MLDCMSNGRLISGFARGIPREYQVHNVPLAQSRARFEEAFDIITSAWTEEVFSYRGEFWSYKVCEPGKPPRCAIRPRGFSWPDHGRCRAAGRRADAVGHFGRGHRADHRCGGQRRRRQCPDQPQSRGIAAPNVHGADPTVRMRLCSRHCRRTRSKPFRWRKRSRPNSATAAPSRYARRRNRHRAQRQ